MKISDTIRDFGRRIRSPFSTAKTPSLSESFERSIQIEKRLNRSTLRFEKEFLNVLEILEKLQSASESLSSQCGTMLDLSQSDENPVKRVSSKLAPNLEFISNSSQSITELVETLESNRQKIEKTLAFEPQLDQTFTQLTYIRTLFTIEAAPLEQNAKVMFTSLVEEINRLQGDVTQIFKKNFHFLRANHDTIHVLCSKLGKQARDQRTAYKRSKSEMDTAVRLLSEKQGQDSAANASLKNQGDQIYQSVGNAIISLQTQDIVSQKLEHIYSVSKNMRQRFASVAKIKGKRKRCIEYRFIENAALLILNQIDSIKTELQDADRSIDRNIAEIKQCVSVMESTSEQMDSGKSANEGKGIGLIEDLRNTGRMARNCERFLDEAFKTIEPIRDQTNNVSSTIERLSSQLHLIGLNAEIHAARTGGSTALETLSAKTSGISVETRDLCASISIQLDGLSVALRENVNVLESLLEKTRTTHTEIRRDIPVEAENFEQQNQLYHACHAKTREMMVSLSSATQNHEARLDFEATMLEELNEMQRVQNEISREAKRAADKLKVSIDIPELMSEILESYTMKSEQTIHLQTVGGQIPSHASSTWQTSSPDQGTQAENIDSWDFEDFSRDSNQAKDASPQKKDRAQADNSIELF